MLGDIFGMADGAFRSDVFQFREDPSNPGFFQVRVGQYINADTGWTTITFTDFAQYVADALSHKNAAEAAKTATESARDDALPVINNIDKVIDVADNITDVSTVAGQVVGTKTYATTVAGGKFYLDNVSNPEIELKKQHTYTFDQTDSTNDGHPFAFKDSGGNSYTTGVTYFLNGASATESDYTNTTTFNAGAATGDRKVVISITATTPSSLLYYCTVHGNGMGNDIDVVDHNLDRLSSIAPKIIASDTAVSKDK